MQPLHDDDDRRTLRRVQPGGDGLREHPQHGLALQVRERAFDRVRVVVEHPVAAVPGHRRRRHRGAEAGRGVLELELGVLVGGEAERPEPLIPLRLHQPPHPHVVAHRQVLGVRRADVAQLRLRPRSPLPGRPEHADRERLHRARRHVDQQPVDLAGGHRLEVLGDRVDVPAVDVGRAGLDHRPGAADEVDELAGAELALDREPVTLAQAHGRGPPSARRGSRRRAWSHRPAGPRARCRRCARPWRSRASRRGSSSKRSPR